MTDGAAILDLTSELRVSTLFQLYATPSADSIREHVQANMMEVIRDRAKRAPGP